MMSPFNEPQRLNVIEHETRALEEVIEVISSSLSPPILYHSGHQHVGFRFVNPNWRHFCLLKAVRAVSAINAIVVLYRSGYSQEIAVIIRTVVECTSHIEYVLAGVENDILGGDQDKYVKAFFADFRRNTVDDFRKHKVVQAVVHKTIGDKTDATLRSIEEGRDFANVSMAKLLSNVYLTYSNYVHCRYPEVMDMFGGSPSHFHLRGMRGTPKDQENLDQIESFTVSVSNSLRAIIISMQLVKSVESNDSLRKWFPAKSSLS